jgi:AraC-like DNA-binding protein
LHKNFNDYINELRIEEFIKLFKSDKGRQFTMLSIALDSGFNSKATFNRAFKKIKGCSPKEYLSKF